MQANRHENTPASRVGFAPTLLANLLPLGGIIWLDWRISELFAIYWIEIWILLFTYGSAALFAQRPLIAKGRTMTLPGVSRDKARDESRWGGEPRTISLFESLPPMYPRNFRLTGLSLVWGIGLLVQPVLMFDNTLNLLSTHSLSLAGTAVAIAGSHLFELRREFFADRQYEEMSAHMVLEIPCRVIFFAFCYVMCLLFVGVLCLLAIGAIIQQTNLHIPDEAVVLSFVTLVVLGKVFIEWSKYRAETEPNPNGFATWFLAEDPRSSS
ncbi:DUF6498-containing protein [Haladaptatus cibarius]|uniref:DUF6498-containing protein n=1 Tax=Haladaptatus cibarius TaxID=453847 RepID=UPI000678F2E7|nr:DUF6498-containing protein [Haladaptatus cibarius]